MDEISLLRRVRDDIPERSPESVTQGRAALFQKIDSGMPVQPAPRRRRGFAWAGFSALGAGALTVTLVAANVLGAGAPDGADAAAADVLEAAATATLDASDPVLAPGQYLRVATDAMSWMTAQEPSASFEQAVHEELFIPADRADDWVWIRCERSPVNATTPEARQAAADWADADEDAFYAASGEDVAKGTAITFHEDRGLSRDPGELLDYIYAETADQGQSREGEALVWIVNLLRQGTTPADLRAALYRAAVLIPGVTVTDDQATLNGSTGIAIGRIEKSSGTREDFVIDAETGAFIGERSVAVDASGNPLPDAKVWSTSVTTTVVDTTPSDTSLCEEHR